MYTILKGYETFIFVKNTLSNVYCLWKCVAMCKPNFIHWLTAEYPKTPVTLFLSYTLDEFLTVAMQLLFPYFYMF